MDGALVASVPACSLKMSRPTKPRIEELQARIGHAFSRVDLLTLALTHVSAASVRSRLQSYQRLEFLGDRVLGLAVAAMLYELFPASEEGDLSRRLAALVRSLLTLVLRRTLVPNDNQPHARRLFADLGEPVER